MYRRRRTSGQERRRRETRRPEQRGVEQGLASEQPGFETRQARVRHGPQRHEGAQIVIGRRDELAAGSQELIDERLCFGAARRIASPQDEQVAEFQRRIDSGRRHRGLEAGLECDGVGVAEVTEAIVLFAVALVTELEREPCVERGALGIGVRLDHAIYRVRQAEMTEENLASSHQESADRRTFVRIFVQQTSDDRRVSTLAGSPTRDPRAEAPAAPRIRPHPAKSTRRPRPRPCIADDVPDNE